MKLKQKIILNLVAVLTVAAGLVVLSPPPSAEALTKNEKKQCYQKWAGAYTGSSGDGKHISGDQLDKFEKNNKCSKKKGGSCRIVRYTDGAVIHCQRKDGKYDNGSGGWNGTDGGSDDGGTGDDGEDTGGGGECKTAILPDSLCKGGDKLEDNGIFGILLLVISVLTGGVVLVAIGGFVYAAILYTTAEANAAQVTKAKETIFNVVLGLAMFALMWAFLQFIIPGGVFSG